MHRFAPPPALETKASPKVWIRRVVFILGGFGIYGWIRFPPSCFRERIACIHATGWECHFPFYFNGRKFEREKGCPTLEEGFGVKGSVQDRA